MASNIMLGHDGPAFCLLSTMRVRKGGTGIAMISSTNAFGGLSSTDLLKLFGTNSASASNTTSANTTQSSGSGLSSVSSAATAIQAIVAQVQIDKTPIEAPEKPVSLIATNVQAAYSAQMSDGTTTTTLQGQMHAFQLSDATTNKVQETSSETDYTGQISDGTSTRTTVGRESTYENMSGSEPPLTIKTGFSSVSPASASDSTGESGQDAQSGWADSFEMGISVGGVSVDINFGEAGLDQTTLDPSRGYVVGQGSITESFQLNVNNASTNMTVSGLTAAQAKGLTDAYNSAVGAAVKGLAGSSGLSLSTVATTNGQFTPQVWTSSSS